MLIAGLVGREREANAKCVDVGCVVDWVYILLVPVVIAGATVLVVDVVETSTDIGEASAHRPPSRDRATFEAGWGGTQAALGGTVAIALMANDEVDTAIGLLAFSSWPLGLAMHGGWGRTADPYDGFPSSVLPVAGLDLGVATYDVVRLARRERTSSGYGMAEMFGALPQIGVGLAAAAGGRRADVPVSLALTALPTLLFMHGIYEIAAKNRGVSADATDAPPPATRPATWRVVPTMGREPNGTNAGLAVVGRF